MERVIFSRNMGMFTAKTEVEAKCKVVCKHTCKYLHKNNTTKMPVESCDDGQGGYYPAVVAIVLFDGERCDERGSKTQHHEYRHSFLLLLPVWR